MSIAVAIATASSFHYPEAAPFHPDTVYPEFSAWGARAITGPANPAFSAVRDALRLLGLDRSRFGTDAWNPLGAIVKPGGTIVLKPNLVLHELGSLVGAHTLCTDGSVIRAVADYALLAVGQRGRIIIADTPIQGADFGLLARQLGLDAVVAHFQATHGVTVTLQDLRREWAFLSDDGTQILRRQALPGDPLGYTTIDLGRESALEEISGPDVEFSITDYRDSVTQAHHRPGLHEYLISNTILTADAVVSIPKMKTHQKAGITAGLKNFVGINGAKDYLAHHRTGSPKSGGDEYPEPTLFNVLFAKTRKVLNERAPHWLWTIVRRVGLRWRKHLSDRAAAGGASVASLLVGAGGWHGNDTVWRTLLDINKAFFLYDPSKGGLSGSVVRPYLCVVDGIIGGEGNGPLSPTPKPAGVVIASRDPVAADVCAATLMGFEWTKVHCLREYRRLGPATAFAGHDSLDIATESVDVRAIMNGERPEGFRFRPSDGWMHHVEATTRTTIGTS